MTFPDSTGAGMLSRWTPILTQCPNRKTWCLKGYRHPVYPLQTSPTPPLPGKNVQHAYCTLYSMPSLHTVWCGHQCSVLCFACWCATLHHLHTSNANANRALVPPYKNVSAVVNLRVVGKRCQTSCTTCRSTTMGLCSHVALSHCAFSTSLVDFHTLYDQPFGPSVGRFFFYRHAVLQCSTDQNGGVSILLFCGFQQFFLKAST